MSDTVTEIVEDEVVPFTEGDREIAYRSEAVAQQGPGATGRPAVVAAAGATGRRKEAVARVRIAPGSGQWTINGRTLDNYFPNKVHQQIVAEPFLIAGILTAIKEIIVLSVKAANEYLGKGPEFARALTEIGVLGGLVAVLSLSAVLLRRKEKEPEENSSDGPSDAAKG